MPTPAVHITLGALVPAFSLPDQTRRRHAIRNYRGRWVVLFLYAEDGSPSCTQEAREFDMLSRQIDPQVVILGISPDSIESHRQFAERYSLRLPLLSDPTHQTIEKLGGWGEKSMYGKKYSGVIRTTCILDPNNIIVASWTNLRVNGHVAKVHDKLMSLRGTSPPIL